MSSTKAPRKPQGALEWNEKQVQKVLDKQGYVLGFPKIDGVRLILRVSPNGVGQLRSRSGKNFPALKDFEEALNGTIKDFARTLSEPVEFEGELTVTGEDGKDLPCGETSGVLQRLEQVRPERLAIRLYDRVADSDLAATYVTRRSQLEGNSRSLKNVIEATGAWATCVEYRRLASFSEIFNHYEEMRRRGWEGGIYRDPSCPVRAGKVLGMWKRKPHETQDGIITRLIEAVDLEGNPKGMVGSIVVAYEDGTTGKAGAGALTHAERGFYWYNPDQIIGRYCEVKMMEETGKGGKRHPNFLMFRDTVDNKGVKV